jgi:hypothetical protein
MPRLTMKFMTKNFWPSWMPLRSGIIYLKEFNINHCVFLSQESSIFRDNSCVESTSSSMGITLFSISIHDYLPSAATTRETICFILSLVHDT